MRDPHPGVEPQRGRAAAGDRRERVVHRGARAPPGRELAEQPRGEPVVGMRPIAWPLLDVLPPQAHVVIVGPGHPLQDRGSHAVGQHGGDARLVDVEFVVPGVVADERGARLVVRQLREHRPQADVADQFHEERARRRGIAADRAAGDRAAGDADPPQAGRGGRAPVVGDGDRVRDSAGHRPACRRARRGRQLLAGPVPRAGMRRLPWRPPPNRDNLVRLPAYLEL